MESFIEWWQHIPFHLTPWIFKIGSFKLQYYGLMYILAFVLIYFLAVYRTKNEDEFLYTENFHKDILTAAFIGVLVGGRLGYVLFYNLNYYLSHPLEIIWPFRDGMEFVGISGMSYHGGLIGVLISVAIFCKNRGASYRNIADLYGPIIPLGYTFGRIGNFINGELYGRVTESAIGMYFKADPEVLRHPSQLYEAFFEGIVCFALLWWTRKIKSYQGARVSFFLMSYGLARFFIEYFREPDSHLGFVFMQFSMGQLLCLGMILTGIISLVIFSKMKKFKDPLM